MNPIRIGRAEEAAPPLLDGLLSRGGVAPTNLAVFIRLSIIPLRSSARSTAFSSSSVIFLNLAV
jgi:hypothetical protein